MDFQNILQHGFRNLLHFEGRDTKQQFLVFYLTIFLSLFTFSAFLFLEDAIDSYQAAESYTSQSGPNMMSWSTKAIIDHNDFTRERTKALQTQAIISGAKFGFVGLLLPCLLTLSSMIRRLHDIGLSGRWLFAVFGFGFFLLPVIRIFLPVIPIFIAFLALRNSDANANRFGKPVSIATDGEGS